MTVKDTAHLLFDLLQALALPVVKREMEER